LHFDSDFLSCLSCFSDLSWFISDRQDSVMPPRLISLAILAFWLATMGWLVNREIAPALRAGQPPPFAIDLADEAQVHAPRIRWVILQVRDGKETKIGRARTWVSYRPADDSFELHNETDDLALGGLLLAVRVPRMNSMYRVRPDGTLREMTTKLDANVRAALSNLDIKAELAGEVRSGQFFAHGVLEAAGWGRHELDLQPVPVSANGTVLNPLHPVNRITGLQMGQQWRMPLVDPLADAVRAQVGDLPGFKSGPKFLNATVLDKPQSLKYEGRPVDCLVIEYRGDDELAAKTWVRESDGLVLRQEAAGFGDRVILQRE
jgi:hypothetical protein